MTVRRLLTAVLVGGVLAGCAGSGDVAQQGPASDGTVSYPFPAGAVPEAIRVREPKDARGVDPCGLLSAGELRFLGLDPLSVEPDLPGDVHVTGCNWSPFDDPDELVGFSVRVDSPQPALRGVYIRSERMAEHFEPTQVGGHPAVAVRDSSASSCSLEVGVADDQLMSVSTSAERSAPDDCGWARRIAAAVLSHLPPRTR